MIYADDRVQVRDDADFTGALVGGASICGTMRSCVMPRPPTW